MTPAKWIAIPLLLALSVSGTALAEDAEAPAVAPASEPAASEPAPATAQAEASGDGEDPPPVVKKPRKGRRGGREKEAEGTQAPNRFEADTVIKSQYKLDGQPLEVDPD